MSHLARVEKLLENKGLNESSRSFAQSLLANCKRWGSLTDKQWSAFERMEARYDPAVIDARKEWNNAWNDEKARKLKIAAQYYLRNPPYFGEVAKRIVEEETYIPSAKLYRKMVENKYVQKVLATCDSEPAFAVGSLVKVRKTARSNYALRDKIALVVSNDSTEITSAAKGGRPYTILPFGEDRTYKVEERWLKKHRG